MYSIYFCIAGLVLCIFAHAYFWSSDRPNLKLALNIGITFFLSFWLGLCIIAVSVEGFYSASQNLNKQRTEIIRRLEESAPYCNYAIEDAEAFNENLRVGKEARADKFTDILWPKAYEEVDYIPIEEYRK